MKYINEQKPLTKGEKVKQRVIRCAADLFIKNGYYATGIKEVIEATGLSKGSFYFYFESKKTLAVAVFDFYQDRLISTFRKMAMGRTWEIFVNELMQWILGNTEKEINYGCPFAVLGMETAFIEPEISKLSYAALLETVEVFQIPLMNSGLSEQEAQVCAERMFSTYEGYMLRYRLSKDVAELHKLWSAMKDCI